MKISRVIILFLLANFSIAAYVSSEERSVASHESIKITSDQLEADKKAGVVIFTGNVIAKQDDSVIMSDTLTVYYNNNQEMEKIVAVGDVRINQHDRVGTCRSAVFYPGEKRIVMEDDPRIWKDGDMITGDVITIYMDSERMLVEGAKAVIRQEKKGSEEVSMVNYSG